MKGLKEILIVLALFAILSCGRSITKDMAFTKAIERIKTDSIMVIDLKLRDQEITSEGKNWHVSFPYKPISNMRGGEPHVLVEKKSGKIVKVFYTR